MKWYKYESDSRMTSVVHLSYKYNLLIKSTFPSLLVFLALNEMYCSLPSQKFVYSVQKFLLATQRQFGFKLWAPQVSNCNLRMAIVTLGADITWKKVFPFCICENHKRMSNQIYISKLLKCKRTCDASLSYFGMKEEIEIP